MATVMFSWTEYLRLATELSRHADEASQRTATSRAYYAVFHAATLHARANGYAERSHGRLWKMYQADPDENAKRLSLLGNQMKMARENADYKEDVSRVGDAMQQQLLDAHKFGTILALVPPTSPQSLPPAPRRTCPNCGATES